MYNTNIFSTPIWGYVLQNQQQYLSAYIAKILEISKNTPTAKKSNFGGWQSQDMLQLLPEFKHLVTIIQDISTKALEPYKTSKPHVQAMWANLNFKHNFNAHHTHEGWLSGVFYLQVPQNSGRLIFTNPAIRSEQSPVRASNYVINPQPLACILFPSWLEHYVEPNQNDTPRISISFNIGE